MKLPKINTYHLIVFFYVATEKSITSAAEKLCLTQPTVSDHIKSLENDLQTKLIEITRQRIFLTRAGEGLYSYAKEIYTQALAAERFVENLRSSNINVGISQLVTYAAKRAMITLLSKENFSANIYFEFGSAVHLIQDVIDSKLDIAVIPRLNFKEQRLKYIRISDGVKLVFFASPNHPVFKNSLIEWKDLCDYPLVISGDSPTGRMITEKLLSERVKSPLSFNFRTSSIELRKILVQDSNCISIALEEDIKPEVNSGLLKILQLPGDIWLEIDAVVYRGSIVSPLIQEFISCMKLSF